MTYQNNATFQIWAPFAFSVLLTLLKQSSSGGSGDAGYFSFLPMCFFGVAIVHRSILARIKVLEAMADRRVTNAPEA